MHVSSVHSGECSVSIKQHTLRDLALTCMLFQYVLMRVRIKQHTWRDLALTCMLFQNALMSVRIKQHMLHCTSSSQTLHQPKDGGDEE